jgi:3-hydroxyisobutyrate dehydrogenase-like beta-hydroxyacid dehydrogenase
MRIAFLGLGNMGRPMAARVIGAGIETVVWNRTRAVADRFATEHECRVAASPAEASAGADVVLSMLGDDAAVRSVYSGPGGVFESAPPGALLIDLSTISPDTVRELASEATRRGYAFVDAPVSGSVAAAAAGSLTVMAAGPRDAVERAEPVLSVVGSKVVHLGAQGAGAAMKLSVNTVVHALNNALAEALVLAERAGIDRLAAYEVFLNSAVAAPFVDYRRAAFEHPETTPTAFRLRLAVKDLDLALALADRVGADLPQARINRRIMRAAADAGYAEHDESAVAQFHRDLQAAPDHGSRA